MRAHHFNLVIALFFVAIFWGRVAGGDESTSSESTQSAELECCSCDYLSTKTFPGNKDFQCSFDYPAHWELRYIPSENSVDIRAPRCEKRCGGSRSMVFFVSTGKDNNAEIQEKALQADSPIVGTASCGGRDLTIYRPRFMEINKEAGMNHFHVGNNDGKAYDARIQYACPKPGDWQKLESLFKDSLQ